MSYEFRGETFTAGEAERITGVTAIAQRNLRRHDYLSKSRPGWSRFNLLDLSKMIVIGSLSEKGVPPALSVEIAESAAVMVHAHAANDPEARYDPEKLAGNQPVVHLPPYKMPRFLVWFGETHQLVRELDEVFEAKERGDEVAASIVLDLPRLAKLIVKRAQRPLITVVPVR